MAIFGKFFGRTIGEAAAFALGGAMRSPLEPPLVELTNETWAKFVDAGITVPTDADTAAAIAAEDVATVGWAKDQAKQRGVGGDQMDKLIGEALNGPGLGELFQALRRGLITDAQFEHGLRKAKLETLWDAPLRALRRVLLTPEQLANARQQGFVDEGRQNVESVLQGLDPGDAEILFDIVGLPPGVMTGLDLWRRGIIDRPTFDQIVREGHTKTKYTDDLAALFRHLLTPTEYVDAHLRGYITEAEMLAGTGLHGITDADAQILFESHGRPIPVHQITTGKARGGTFNGPTDAIPEEYIASLREGSIKPPYYNLAYANRYSLPSFFVVRALVQDGKLSQAEGATIFKESGWPPDLADKAAAAYAPSSGAKPSSWLTKARGYVFTLLHKSYVNTPAYEAKAREGFTLIGVPASEHDAILELFRFEETVGTAASPPGATAAA